MLNRKAENIRVISKYFPEILKNALLRLELEKAGKLCEIRIRSGLPVVLNFTDEKCFVTVNGRITQFYSNDIIILNEPQISSIFEAMCNYSVYSLTDNIRNGFITLENGCRVGLYGTAVSDNGKIQSVRNICGLNVRVAGDFSVVSDNVTSIFRKKKSNILVCGPPSGGKTTLLRSLCRYISDELQQKVCVVDERFEFRDYYLGNNTDVLSGYPKAAGVELSVRTLSPDYIVFDELGSVDEVSAVADSINCGVNVIMSIHCKNIGELAVKKHYRLLNEVDAVDYCVFLGDILCTPEIFSVEEIRNAYNGFADCGNSMRVDRKLFC